jgi:hypothetical protein
MKKLEFCGQKFINPQPSPVFMKIGAEGAEFSYAVRTIEQT